MARPLRIEYPGAYYHVTTRGVARQDVFLVDDDRQHFLDYVREAVERWRLRLHAYCLMGNHYHLDIESPEGPISRPIQWLNQTYASYINRRHDRVGHLFQGRFKSAVVEADSHLLELTRYIHLNPVRSGVVKRPIDYSWSSYRAYVGACKAPDWLTTEEILAWFGKPTSQQRARYRAFVEQSEGDVVDPLRDLQFGAILGSPEFVERIRDDSVDREPDREASHLAQARPRPGLASICGAIAEAEGVPEELVRTRGRHDNEARDMVLYLARRHSGSTLAELGEHFGGVGAAAVSIACKRIEAKLETDRGLRKRVEDVEERLTTGSHL